MYGCAVVNENQLPLIPWIAKISGSCTYGSMGEWSFIFGEFFSFIYGLNVILIIVF